MFTECVLRLNQFRNSTPNDVGIKYLDFSIERLSDEPNFTVEKNALIPVSAINRIIMTITMTTGWAGAGAL